MKRIIALLLVLTMMLTGCGQAKGETLTAETSEITTDSAAVSEEWIEVQPEFDSLSDENLLHQVENLVYRETVQALNSEEYFVENVSAVYISKEYLEEVAFNSQSNVYFGYTLAELDEVFQGSRYIFTLGDDGNTTVQQLQEIDDKATETMIKNVAIGIGVILACVTVSVVSGGTGAPAVSVIFAASAKSGAIMALSSGGFGAVSAGIVRGIQTGDFEEAMEAAAVAGSEGFKWGALTGSLTGGFEKTLALYGATINGLTMNQAALIQQESKLPLEFIKNFHSMDEYVVLKNASLNLSKVNGKMALTQKINWDFVGDIEDGRTNAQRVIDGLSPLDSTGKAYELHHIGQKKDSPLAILTNKQHKENYSILHENTGSSVGEKPNIGSAWAKQREEFWKALLKMTQEGI